MSSTRKYYLMKSEPDVFSIKNLSEMPNQTSAWDGVRNHEAKKTMNNMNRGFCDLSSSLSSLSLSPSSSLSSLLNQVI